MLQQQGMFYRKIRNTTNWCIAYILATLVSWITIFLSRGEKLSWYFHNNPLDTSMDYFNVLNLSGSDKIYEGLGNNYPPICYVIMKILHYFVPAATPSSMQIANYQNVPGIFLRNYQNSLLIYLLIIIFSTLILLACINSICNQKSAIEKIIISIATIVSGPFVYMIERGNIILFAFLGIMIFIACYESNNRAIRILGYFGYAFATAIKLYPAVFAILLIRKKRWKSLAFTSVLAIAMFFIPFIAFGGVSALLGFIRGLTSFTSDFSTVGLGLQLSMSNMSKIVSIFLPESDWLFFALPGLHVIMLIACTFVCFFEESEWRVLFILGIMCSIIPSVSFTYSLVFLIPCLLNIMANNVLVNKNDLLLVLLLFSTLFTYILPIVSFPGNLNDNVTYPLYWGYVIINFSLYLSLFLLSGNTLVKLKAKTARQYSSEK